MSKYTTELRFICENYAGFEESLDYTSVNSVIEKARPIIFNFEYPLFDENYKKVLETKIIKHFYFREIGFETVALWKMNLENMLNEIMPYYNKLYESEKIIFNPMYDTDVTTDYLKKNESSKKETETRDVNSESTLKGNENISQTSASVSTGTTGGSSTVAQVDEMTNKKDLTDIQSTQKWNYFSDTPQGTVANIQNKTYLTNASNDTSDVTIDHDETTASSSTSNNTAETKGTSSENVNASLASKNEKASLEKNNQKSASTLSNEINTTDDYVQHVRGKSSGVSFSKMLQEFRQTFLNIDTMIINDLEVLFMQIW